LLQQEFSIEIPDKEADQIHSGMSRLDEYSGIVLAELT
jgi:acyl carrier protein